MKLTLTTLCQAFRYYNSSIKYVPRKAHFVLKYKTYLIGIRDFFQAEITVNVLHPIWFSFSLPRTRFRIIGSNYTLSIFRQLISLQFKFLPCTNHTEHPSLLPYAHFHTQVTTCQGWVGWQEFLIFRAFFYSRRRQWWL